MAAFALSAVLAGTTASQKKSAKIEGPNACVECHTKEGEVWKKTHHYATFRDMPRKKEARTIAKKMKIKRMKASKLCLGCHFTTQKVKKKNRVISGISCESCHGAGQNYIETHAEFSGKKNKQSESKAEAQSRWKKSESAGMIRPKALYKLATNCYSCHVVPREKLVNVGGHPAGSEFELYSWSQGEVRHNVWYSNGKTNKAADANRKRMLFIVGLAVELDTALRAVGDATEKKAYAVKMALRADAARKKMSKIAEALPNVPQMSRIVELGYSAGLKLKNKKALLAAANGIKKETKAFVSSYDGSQLAAIDPMIPGPKKFKGKPSD